MKHEFPNKHLTVQPPYLLQRWRNSLSELPEQNHGPSLRLIGSGVARRLAWRAYRVTRTQRGLPTFSVNLQSLGKHVAEYTFCGVPLARFAVR
jgi:hypothetical protein